MFYYVYKITNLINNKIYIGKHKTENLDDGYMGSGKLITAAIKKYGEDNFDKEIIMFFNNDYEAFIFEKLIVDEEFVKREDTYNINLGGDGGCSEEMRKKMSETKKGHSVLDETRHKIAQTLTGRKQSEETCKKRGDKLKGENNPMYGVHRYGEESPFYGKHHSEETKKKLSESRLGKPLSEETKQKLKGRTPWNKGKHISKFKIQK